MREKTELFLKKDLNFSEVITAVFDEDLEEQEQLEREAAIENAAVFAETENADIQEPKKLKRELRAEALVRLENSARAITDFEEIVKWYDRLDANRERKERYHEICRGDNVPLDYNADENGVCFPRSINKYLWKQIQKGEFIETIYDCPHELQELVTEPYISEIIGGLTAEQKEILYYIIKGYSTSKIACIRGQTDRNIRKVRNTLFKKIRKQIYEYLNYNKQHSMTAQEKSFVKSYRKLIDNSK